MYYEYKQCRLYPIAILITSLMGSLCSPVYAEEKSHEQEFIVTAYYSPLPNQCCYFRGSYDEEITFNGKGTHGADGTAVYPGMIAAPSTYAFGTVIRLPGVGIGTVHDRGSRIIEWGDDVHRIDLWMGAGEEGLARALAWGVRSVRGTVYPAGAEDAPSPQFSFEGIEKNSLALASLQKTDTVRLLADAAFGDEEYAVRVLQSTLKKVGYFDESITGTFGTVTQASLSAFLRDYGLDGDGKKVEPLTSATLTLAAKIPDEHLPDVVQPLQSGAEGKDVRQVQKILRYLGYYRGRTSGKFDEKLKKAVIALQTKKNLIADANDPFAGRIGPITKDAMLTLWKAKIIAAKAPQLVLRNQIISTVHTDGLFSQVLSKGDKGREVRLLQTFLLQKGYLENKDITGSFGQKTHDALVQYQLTSNIIASRKAHGAGVFGPSTKMKVANDFIESKWKQVLADGIQTL